jgi:molecular chaperone GrpE
VSEENSAAENSKTGETAEACCQKEGEASCDELGNQLEKLKEEVAAARDQTVRAHAEMQNIRRRAEQDVEKAHKFALDRFAGDIVNVADNLERALGTVDKADEKQKTIAEGLELTLKSLLDTLAKHGVQQLNPLGEPFNPQQQEAIAMVPNPAMEPNSVMDVMQKGYALNGRVIRPARVVVSKAP